MQIKVMIFELVFLVFFLAIYFAVDKTITNKRLKETQLAWDKYSKDMTWQERSDNYLEWCEKHRQEKDWKHCYFPIELHVRPTVFQTTINGTSYRGTKQEISKMSGVNLKILESFGRLPEEMIIRPNNKE